MMKTLTDPPTFHPGRCVMTQGAAAALADAGQSPADFIARHIKRDWGDLGKEDARANDRAMRTGERLLSAYKTTKGEDIWVISEAIGEHANRAKRDLTTILTPSEY